MLLLLIGHKTNMRKSRKILTRRFYPIIVVPLFICILLTGLYAEDIQCEWAEVERIVAIGDLHGDYENFIKILKHPDIKIVDDELHWIAGKTHLVQIGDVLDRGDRAKDIFNLIMDLEKEAEEAGGKVHMLIGNHEEMNIGDRSIDRPGYVTIGQLRSFLPDKYKERYEKKIRKKSGRNPAGETDSNSPLNPDIKGFWEKKLTEIRGDRRHPIRREYVKNFNETYGRWIIKHNAVIKINDIVFVHGGISEKWSTWPLKEINDLLRMELDMWRIAVLRSQAPLYKSQIIYEEDGPLWYRGFARPPEEEELFQETVERVLKNLNAKSMVTAHTPQRIDSPEKMKKYGGLIWIIDTTISDAYPPGGLLSALIIDDYGKILKPWGIHKDKKNTSDEDKNEFKRMIGYRYFIVVILQFSYLINLKIEIHNSFFKGGEL
jgi:hypothetical protein